MLYSSYLLWCLNSCSHVHFRQKSPFEGHFSTNLRMIEKHAEFGSETKMSKNRHSAIRDTRVLYFWLQLFEMLELLLRELKSWNKKGTVLTLILPISILDLCYKWSNLPRLKWEKFQMTFFSLFSNFIPIWFTKITWWEKGKFLKLLCISLHKIRIILGFLIQ